ncbi:hypothetical protein JZ751_020612 [Albula glossodonta]|uniref:C2H2-type domain-containing protein n=1 Tax=Albula glossodonta TaxID=121402 RepID=A0A8T2PJ22_9TELE|nr:hypothetical protein JZ751_020612 [Albula glossodonta]
MHILLSAGSCRFMNHMKHHLELEKQSNESWDSHTTCQHCFRQYSTPFQLQCHIESAHSPYESTMESHFRTVHENTKDLLCPFCLKVLRSGHMYMQHYMKHQKKGIHRCGKCRLNFLTYKEKTDHKTQFHRTFKKPKTLEGLPPGTKVTIRASLLGGSPTSASAPSRSIVSIIPSSPTSKQQSKPHSSATKSRSSSQSPGVGKGRPFQNRKQERLNSKLQERSNEALRNVRNHMGPQTCVECYTRVSDFYSHYPMVLNCGACKYRTCCKKSFENHMIRFHSAVSRDRFKKMKKPRGRLRGESEVLQADLEPLDERRTNNEVPQHSESSVENATKFPEADSNPTSEKVTEEGETPIRSQAKSSDGEDPEKEEKEPTAVQDSEQVERGEEPGEPSCRSPAKQEKHKEQQSESTPPSSPTYCKADKDKVARAQKDDVPFEEFLRKASKPESAGSDASEQGNILLEPLTPSKVLEHEATEILQKTNSPAPESKAGALSDSTDETSRPSSPDKSKDTSA